MPRKPFTCPQCGRAFLLAAHLARHSRVHRGAMNSAPSPSPGKAALDALRSYRNSLASQQDAIVAKADAVATAIRLMDGETGLLRPRLFHTSETPYVRGTLKYHIHAVLARAKAPMSPKAISTAVLRSGFHSTNHKLAKKVNESLAEMPIVKRVDHGLYAMR